MIKYVIYDAKLGIYWDAISLGLQRYHDSPQSAIADWESDNPPVTPQKQHISFYKDIVNEWCVPSYDNQCRFFMHKVNVETGEYELITHNDDECKYEKEERGNKYGRTIHHQKQCEKQGFTVSADDLKNPFINNQHRQ